MLLIALLLGGCGSVDALAPQVSATITLDGEGPFPSTGAVTLLAEVVGNVSLDAAEWSAQWDLAGSEPPGCATLSADGDQLVSACTVALDGLAGPVSVGFVARGPELEAAGQATIDVVANAAPVVTWIEPASGIVGPAGHPFDVALTLEDEGELSPTWGGVLASAPPTLTDGVYRTTLTLSEGRHTASVSVSDEWAATTTAARDIELGPPNQPPTCRIVDPTDGARLPGSAAVTFTGTFQDDGGAAALDVVWTSSRDGDLPGTGAPSTVTASLSAGTHVVTLTVTDAYGASCSDLILVRVNRPPQLLGLAISPIGATSADVLTCAPASIVDDDGDGVVVRYAWQVDGVGVGAGDTLPPSLTTPGATVTCTATANDGYDDGQTEVASVDLVIPPPTATGLTVAPDAPTTSDALTCAIEGFSSPSGGFDQSEITWWRGGTAIETGALLPAHQTSRGDVITCRATLFDGYANGATLQEVRTIQNSPPSVRAALVPAVPLVGDVLTCSATRAEDPDGDVLSESVQWFVDGLALTPEQGSQWVSGGQLDTSDLAYGDQVHCTLTMTDGNASESASTVPVALGALPSVTLSVPAADAVLIATQVAPSGTHAHASSVTVEVSTTPGPRSCTTSPDGFSCPELPLVEGLNTLTATATNPFGQRATTVTVRSDPYGCFSRPDGPFYVDRDGDAYGTEVPAPSCGAGAALVPGDCDDEAPEVHPGRSERAMDDIDNDCSGYVDDLFIDDPSDLDLLFTAPLFDVVVFTAGVWEVEEDRIPSGGYWLGDRAGARPRIRLKHPLYIDTTSVRIENLILLDGDTRNATGAAGPDGGCLQVEDGGELELVEVTVWNCTARYGGAIAVIDATLTGTTVSLHDNDVTEGAGAMYVRNGIVDLRGLVVARSDAQREHVGGIIVEGTDSVVDISNAIFMANIPATGAAVLEVNEGIVRIDHATVIKNGPPAGSPVPAMTTHGSGARLEVTNSLFWANETERAFGAYGSTLVTGWNLHASRYDRWVLQDATAVELAPPVYGTPLFTDWVDDYVLNDTLSLRPGSPGVDAGQPSQQDPDGSRADIGALGGPHAQLTPYVDGRR